LVRVTAYYHDIGKIVRPQLFIENQLPGQNPHDALDPAASARLLIAHVTDGEQLARGHGLPQVIIDGILEHHGTLRTEYFYQKAAKESGQADLDDSAFRYPGPRPRSRETAILMLADASEAAVRAASPRSGLELEDVLERIFRQRIVSGQLDDCNLTLRDIQRVREVFVGVLQSIYHPRIRYPEGMEPPDTGAVGPGGTE
jgi:cyclic-di-AMP phosphodiesterase PgpH